MTLGTETETLEFKKSTGELKEAVISIVAILNKHQKGELYFGVKPDGTPVGQVVTEKSLRDISHKISEAVEPKIYPQIVRGKMFLPLHSKQFFPVCGKEFFLHCGKEFFP